MAESRVLLWPCDDDGLPALPIAGGATAPSSACRDQTISESRVRHSSKGADMSHCPGAGFNQHGKFAIIGWMHESQSGKASTTTLTVVAGAIFIPHSNNENAPSAENNLRDKQPPQPTVTLSDESEQGMISRAIQFLSSQFLCIAAKSPCGECTVCATYKSLQILHVFSHDDPDINKKIERQEKAKNHRYQVILYNPRESTYWFIHQTRQQRRNTLYPNGSWERTLLLLGQSCHVLQNLNLAMVYLRHSKITNLTDFTSEEAKTCQKPKKESCDGCRCLNSQETNKRFDSGTTKKHSFSVWNTSLLLSYWNCFPVQHIQQFPKCCNRCSGNIMFRSRNDESRMTVYRTIQLATILGVKVPIISLIKMLSLQEPDSNNEAQFKPSVLPTKNKSKFYSHAACTATSLDAALGLLIGIVCMTCHKYIIHTITYSWKQYHGSFWDDGLVWLQSNPAGVKMNMALTKQIGTGVRRLLYYHARVVSYLFPTNTSATVLLQSIGALTMVFGSRFFFALLFDSSRLVTLHIYILSFLFSSCHRLELSTLSSLWLLFRGKKRNILRLRSDHLDYDHMQLLLGMLLFSICLFLFTTILVHNWFFAVAGCVSELIVSGMWLGYMGVESLFYIEKVLWDRQSGYCMGSHLWNETQVKLHTVSPSERNAYWKRLDNTYIDAFFNGSNPINMNAEKNDDPALPSCVSVESVPTVVSKLSFPMTSNASTVTKAIFSFFISRLTRITAFLSSLIFASRCSITFSCMDMTRSLQQSYKSWAVEQSCHW